MHVKTVPASYEVKAADSEADGFIVTGYASTWTRTPDSYGDIIEKGAFRSSLESRMPRGKVRLLYEHRDVLGKLTSLQEDDHGLKFQAEIAKTALGTDVQILVGMGALEDVSFGYDIDGDKAERNEHGGLTLGPDSIDIMEVSLVGIGANQEAAVLALKSMEADNAASIADIRAELAALKADGDSSDSSSIKPNEGAAAAGKRAQDWIEEGKGGEGLTDTGKQRARQMANREPLSLDTWQRVHAYFSRHASDRDAEGFNSGEEGYPSAGRVAYDAWGGEAGRKQAASIVSDADSDKGAPMNDKAASGSADLPLADESVSWDGPAAMKALAEWASNEDGETDYVKMAQGCFWRAENPESQDDVKLPFCNVQDGKLVAVPKGIQAAAGAVQGARGNPPDIPESDVDGVKAKIAAYYKRMNMTPPWQDDSESGDDGKAADERPDEDVEDTQGDSDERIAEAIEQVVKDLGDVAQMLRDRKDSGEAGENEPEEKAMEDFRRELAKGLCPAMKSV